MKLHRIVAVTRKETREILRDRVTLFLAFLFPLLFMLMFAYAISLDVEDVKLGVLDQDQTPASAALTDAFVASRYFRLVRRYDSEQQIPPSMQTNEVTMVLVIPPGFNADTGQADAAAIQLLIDGSYSATALVALNYGTSIVSRFRGRDLQQIEVQPRVWYNPGLQSIVYVVAGLYAVIIAAIPPLLTTLAIVREKESGAIQQIYASPLTATEFLLGKLVPYWIISCIQLLSITLLAYYWFHMPFNGSPVQFAIAGMLYVFCNVGIGLLISIITRSQLVAVLLAMAVTFMPSVLYSGFIYPLYAMVKPLQWYTMLFPARYFIELSRGIVLKDASLMEMPGPLLALLAYTLAVFFAAALLFRKKVAR